MVIKILVEDGLENLISVILNKFSGFIDKDKIKILTFITIHRKIIFYNYLFTLKNDKKFLKLFRHTHLHYNYKNIIYIG